MEGAMSSQLQRVLIAETVRASKLLHGSKIDERIVRILCSGSTIGGHGFSSVETGPPSPARLAPQRSTLATVAPQPARNPSLVQPRVVIPSSWNFGRRPFWRLQGRLWIKD
jgi:hypothetical protein